MKNIIYRKNAIMAAVLGLSLLMLSACGNKASSDTAVIKNDNSALSSGEQSQNRPETGEEPENAPETQKESEPEKDQAAGASLLDEVYAKVSETVELNNPLMLEDDYIYNIFGIEVSGLDDYIFVISEAAISAETVVILKPADAGDTDVCRENLETVKEYKAAEMRDYLPEQYEVVQEGVISERNGYLYLVISENKDDIIGVIETML